jgi:protein N-terminal methyltransferase
MDSIQPIEATSNNLSKFYATSRDYWAKIPATVNGMLGGYDYVSKNDIRQSQVFLDSLLKNTKMDKNLALDCGAGIGRVSKFLLLRNFEGVDMVDVTESFIEKAKEYLGQEAKLVRNFFVSGLESFIPERNTYDCIWIQWVTGYLDDKDLMDFFKRCKSALKPNGLCVLKDNVSRGEREFDKEDSSYTRPLQEILNLILKADMTIVANEKQTKFPAELYEVRLIAFK